MQLNQTLPLLVLCVFAGANAPAAVRYVDVNSANPMPPYTNWATAATTIQDAVDAAVAGDQILVTNGVYQTGARMVASVGGTNRVVVDKPIAVQSVNGPQFTLIQGYQVPGITNGDGAIRCVYLTNGASLSGFTLTNGATQSDESGGGVWCESTSAVVSNCLITANSAAFTGGGAHFGTIHHCVLTGNSASRGGGASKSILSDCTLTGNSASQYGGGAYEATLNNCKVINNSATYGGGVVGNLFRPTTMTNCTLTGNSAMYGGGAYGGASGGSPWIYCTLVQCTLTGNSATGYLNGATGDNGGGGADRSRLINSIVYYNKGSGPANDNVHRSNLDHSCTTSGPWSGSNSITNAPLFVDTNGWSNLRLQSNSPCINAGDNTVVFASTDLDGRPRIVGGTVDIGVYEFQPGVSSAFIGWLSGYGLPTDGSADYSDSDVDLMNNWQEWIAGTMPTDASSALRMLNPIGDLSGVTVSWQSVSNRTYFLERATDLGAVPPSLSLLAGNIVGQAGTTSYTDTNATGPGPFFYRVGVQQ